MSKFQATLTSKKKYDDITKMYILSTPTKLSNLTLDDMYDPIEDNHSNWKTKAREFRERKERQFNHEF